jgi:hypothetical protein
MAMMRLTISGCVFLQKNLRKGRCGGVVVVWSKENSMWFLFARLHHHQSVIIQASLSLLGLAVLIYIDTSMPTSILDDANDVLEVMRTTAPSPADFQIGEVVERVVNTPYHREVHLHLLPTSRTVVLRLLCFFVISWYTEAEHFLA